MFKFDNSYARELPGFYAACQPDTCQQAELVYFNRALAVELGIGGDQNTQALEAIFSGNAVPEGAEPIAQAYAGHQFGHFNPQLGDGRAHLLGEVITPAGARFDLSFKGSGRTPFSRGGDGKAAIGPMLREVLLSESMHALGVPSTRSLAVVTTGEPVYRNHALPGAVLTRVAASHIRIGTFQYFAAQGDQEKVQRLADYTIARHFPELSDSEQAYLDLIGAVCKRQAELLAHWMSLGFIHGVMNTDNISIAGETIDYGPCAFMEGYDPAAVFSSIDENGRYAYQNQPGIAQWNLARFAETMLPLLADDESESIEAATTVIKCFPDLYQQQWLNRMRRKLGIIPNPNVMEEVDLGLVLQWLHLMQQDQVDFTLAWRALADAVEGHNVTLDSLMPPGEERDTWLAAYRERCAQDDALDAKKSGAKQRAQTMRSVNPIHVPRNHHVEAALSAASDKGDLQPFNELLLALQQPYQEQVELARFVQPASADFMAEYKTFCGT